MAIVSGTINAPGVGSTFAPATGRFTVAVSGIFEGAAVLVLSLDGGNTFNSSPTQGPQANAALFSGGPGTRSAELTDPTPGVLYAVQAVAPPGGVWIGSAAFTFTDVLQATVTVAPGRTLVAGGKSYSAGQTVTIDRSDADTAFRSGFINSSY